MMSRFFSLAFSLALLGCTPQDDPINKFADPVMVKIADLKDRRQADSLYRYFDHPEGSYRKEAVQAFGSLQRADKIERIGKLLVMDPEPAVRIAAAFALGQMAHPSAERLLLGALMKEKVAGVVAEILEAYGKTTRQWQLDPSPFMNDSIKSSGLAWSLYRAAIRGKTGKNANEIAIKLLESIRSSDTRLGAAHYFARGTAAIQSAVPSLMNSARNDEAPEVRMAAVLALGKVQTDSALSVIKKVIREEEDARVIVNAFRALRTFPFQGIKHYLYEGVLHRDPQVGVAASEVLIQTVAADDWIEVSSLTAQVTDPSILPKLYEAALKAGGNPDLAAEIQTRYTKASDPWHKAAMLASLKHYPPAFAFVEAELRSAENPLLRTTAAQTLVAMNKSENFNASLTPQFAARFREIIRSAEDPAVIGSIAIALGDSTLGYDQHLRNTSFLHSAREKLTLPQDNEAMQSVVAAINHLENKHDDRLPANPFNHPIDWDLVKRIPHDQRVIIKTVRGNIIVRLHVDEAPGSVANFITLALQNYFDGSSVHRMVPNFVIQDGCHRGDGWGSEDYSLRSEFSSRPYQTGSLGMASAGKDTEGTQWFITHSPTPHLEGRYTLFGEVVEGQAVVGLLQVGEKITDVEVENFTGQ